MSATINAEAFAHYFNDCPVFNVSGRTFPVDAYFLEDAIEATGYLMEEDSEYAMRKQKERSMLLFLSHNITFNTKLKYKLRKNCAEAKLHWLKH